MCWALDEISVGARGLPGLPPPALVPDPPKGRQPPFFGLRCVVKIGTNAIRGELLQLLFLLLKKGECWSHPTCPAPPTPSKKANIRKSVDYKATHFL